MGNYSLRLADAPNAVVECYGNREQKGHISYANLEICVAIALPPAPIVELVCLHHKMALGT